jgi:hypothetical protein
MDLTSRSRRICQRFWGHCDRIDVDTKRDPLVLVGARANAIGGLGNRSEHIIEASQICSISHRVLQRGQIRIWRDDRSMRIKRVLLSKLRADELKGNAWII